MEARKLLEHSHGSQVIIFKFLFNENAILSL